MLLVILDYHDIQISLRSQIPFFLELCLDPSLNRAVTASTLNTLNGFRFHTSFFQRPTIYTVPPSLLTSTNIQVAPHFYDNLPTKGYIIEMTNINQLRALRIYYQHQTNDNLFFYRQYGPDELATLCYSLSDNHLWIPFNQLQKTPFNLDYSSFNGTLAVGEYYVIFQIENDAPQEFIRIHSIYYNVLYYAMGMAGVRYWLVGNVTDHPAFRSPPLQNLTT